MSSNSKPRFTRYQLPGFGLPLNQSARGRRELYPNALDYDTARVRLTPLREFTMMRFMNEITDKPDWNKKIFDEAIVAKWKTETLSAPAVDITESMVTWCIDELQYKAEEFNGTGFITAYDGDVVKSDTAIPSSLQHALKAAARPLEDVPEICRDWHPGSDDTVLDLVHPSLFPVVYGRTRILPDSIVGLDDCLERCGEGKILAIPPSEEAQMEMSYGLQDPFSRKYQWLPCDVSLEDDRVRIMSYINNLHPKVYKPLYEVIERIIEIVIPFWNQTLTPLKSPFKSLLHDPRRIYYHCCEYDPDPESLPDEEQPQQLPNETEDDFYERKDQWVHDTRRVVRPEPGNFADQWDYLNKGERGERVDLKSEFLEGGLQIIVKLANVHLTPDKPSYAGGTWHVEGQLNEHICATALYYYDNHNITESRLSFRQHSEPDLDIDYEQYDHDWLPEVFGCEQNGFTVQYVGDVATKDGRLVTFPNIFQHRVLPFQLVDETRPGHRKILALFLVDPNIKVISSANVPCQQREWWAQEIQGRGLLQTLPREIQNEVIRNVEDFPIGIEEAKVQRLHLIEERKVFVQRHDHEFCERDTFSLCEH